MAKSAGQITGGVGWREVQQYATCKEPAQTVEQTGEAEERGGGAGDNVCHLRSPLLITREWTLRPRNGNELDKSSP